MLVNNVSAVPQLRETPPVQTNPSLSALQYDAMTAAGAPQKSLDRLWPIC
jgi:hypothetical protein